jgi:hypothetical protein
MGNSKPGGDNAAGVTPDRVGIGNAAGQRTAAGAATAVVVRLRRPMPEPAPDSSDDDPGPQAA